MKRKRREMQKDVGERVEGFETGKGRNMEYEKEDEKEGETEGEA